MKLTRKQTSILMRAAEVREITPFKLLETLIDQERKRCEVFQQQEREIVSFTVALRRCGIEPDDFEDDRKVWLSGGGPIVKFKMPRVVGTNGLISGRLHNSAPFWSIEAVDQKQSSRSLKLDHQSPK